MLILLSISFISTIHFTHFYHKKLTKYKVKLTFQILGEPTIFGLHSIEIFKCILLHQSQLFGPICYI